MGTVLAQLDDQTGAGFVEGIPTDSESLALAMKCEGTGALEVALDGVATFSHQCTAGARNDFMDAIDVRHIEGNLNVTITADEGLRWAFSASGTKLITPAPQPVPTSG